MADFGGVDVSDRTCIAGGCIRAPKCRGLCATHYQRLRTTGTTADPIKPTPTERFMAKVQRQPNGCWYWTGYVIPESGYGQFVLGEHGTTAHRAAYLMLVGSVPDGLEVEHVCHTNDLTCSAGAACLHRRCVNPSHLEVVDHLTNVDRAHGHNGGKTHCPAGHPYDALNTYMDPSGRRRCCACRAEAKARYHAKRLAARKDVRIALSSD